MTRLFYTTTVSETAVALQAMGFWFWNERSN